MPRSSRGRAWRQARRPAEPARGLATRTGASLTHRRTAALDEKANCCYSVRMASSTILVRAKLTDNEWLRIRKLALDRRVPTSQLCGDALRALLKGAKP